MSFHRNSPSAPALLFGAKTDTYRNTGSRLTTPRASRLSTDSVRTWVASRRSPHKAPLLEAMLTTVPATRVSTTSDHAEQSCRFEGEVHTTGKTHIKACEQTSDSGRDRKRNIIGNVVDSPKLPKIFLGGHAPNRDPPHKMVDVADIGDLTTREVATNPTQGSVGHAEIEYLGVPDAFVGSSVPPRIRNLSPHIYDLRNHDHPIYDDDAPQLNVHNYDHYLHESRPCHWQDKDAHALSRTGLGYPYSSVCGNTYLNHDEFGVHADPQESSSPRHSPLTSSPNSAPTESSFQNTLRPPKRRKFIFSRFLRNLYRLPWVSSRIAADYEPGGLHNSRKPTQEASSWYTRRQRSFDFLSSCAPLPTEYDETQISSIAPIPQLSSLGSTRHHGNKQIPTDFAGHTLFPPNGRRDSIGIEHAPYSSTIHTIIDHRHGESRRERNLPATGSKHPPGRKRRRYNVRDPIEKSIKSRSHRPRSKTYPHTFIAFPFPFAPLLFFVTPPNTPNIVKSQVEIRQAVPVFVLTPNSVPPFTIRPQSDGISEPSQHSSPRPS